MIESITQALSQRIRNPWFTGFALAVSACNWKAVLLLFYPENDWNIRERLEYLQVELYNEPNERHFLFLWPILITISWVFVMPWLAALADAASYWASIWKERRTETMNARLPQRERMVAELETQLSDERRLHQSTTQKVQSVEARCMKLERDLIHLHKLTLTIDPELGRLIVWLADRGGQGSIADAQRSALLVQLGLLSHLNGDRHKLTDLGSQLAELHKP